MLFVWDAVTKQAILRCRTNGIVWAVEFDNSGNRIATANDGVWLWNLADGSSQALCQGQASSVSFQNGGNLMGAAVEGARVWDLAIGREVVYIPHAGSMRYVGFEDKHRLLITANKVNTDCIIRSWFLETEDLIAEAHRRVSRGLTRTEWSRYLPEEPYAESRE